MIVATPALAMGCLPLHPVLYSYRTSIGPALSHPLCMAGDGLSAWGARIFLQTDPVLPTTPKGIRKNAV